MEQASPVTLTCSDWEDIYCDNHAQVSGAAGGPRGGPWSVLIEQGGEYEIALRRWPDWVDTALDAGLPDKKMTAGKLPAGKALPIAGAKLSIAGQELSLKAAPGAKAAVFRVKLKGGEKAQLQGWFTDSGGADVCGAYYAYVKRV